MHKHICMHYRSLIYFLAAVLEVTTKNERNLDQLSHIPHCVKGFSRETFSSPTYYFSWASLQVENFTSAHNSHRS